MSKDKQAYLDDREWCLLCGTEVTNWRNHMLVKHHLVLAESPLNEDGTWKHESKWNRRTDNEGENTITFHADKGTREMLRIDADGGFFVEGRQVTTDMEIYDAMKRWLEAADPKPEQGEIDGKMYSRRC